MKTKRLSRLASAVIAIVTLIGHPPVAVPNDAVSPLERLYRLGSDLFDNYVPDDQRDELFFPDPEEWRTFWNDIERILESHSLEDAAAWRPAVEVALKYLEFDQDAQPLVAWLRQKMDYFSMADDALAIAQAPVKPQAAPASPTVTDPRHAMIRNRNEWEKRLRPRPPPVGADRVIDTLKTIFSDEGIPPQWVWIAEVESSMNPAALSPAGAAGLFQFMPQTAERFGLRLTPVDERYSPEKSARAAAQYLRVLHRQFGCWSLALAAYNAGEGRVGRLLARHSGDHIDAIANALPLETQMYVPKVLATVRVRENVDPLTLPPPGQPNAQATRTP